MDHVIPLSLGGSDKFTVWSDTLYNSNVGSKVDGAIANDPIIMFARRHADARGHSNKKPIPRFRKSRIEGKPVQVSFHHEDLMVWDPISQRYLSEGEKTGKTIDSQIMIDAHAPIRFIAKAALGGAYFVYGELIFTTIYGINDLRLLTKLDYQAASANPQLALSQLSVCDRYHEDASDPTSPGFRYRNLCEFEGRTVFICEPHPESISFHVGVLGCYIGSVTCLADTTNYPLDKSHDLGRVIRLGPAEFEQISHREYLRHFYRKVYGNEPPEPMS